MKIETTRFGQIEADEANIFDFIEPIIGFNSAKRFILIENGDSEVFRWLQSIEYADLAFPVTLPAHFGIEYVFEIDDNTATKLELETAENLLTFNIVSIPQGSPQDSTINLLAPILINEKTKKGLQYIIPNSKHIVKQRLFAETGEVV